MAIIKCKMCGGDLNLIEGSTVAECEYCGTTQTVPSADNEKKLTLFGRAGRLLRSCEFDKAAGVFETIVADFPEEAEAYWGLVLCKYGIEYVDDPATGKKIPTCHRSSFDSVFDDENFEQAQENADAVARRVYREEAKAIEDIRKGIIEVSGKEEPYDIFICYKETAEDGNRTLDSVLAQDIYDALTEKGYRVFFSRVTLEDKLGQEYEPYIFAALNSAKIMLAIGTTYDYYNAVWVKNEWSRFLKLIASGEKKTLIPCFKNLDPYDMPKEFAKLQSQDLGKVGAIQDLLRGIEKIIPLNKDAAQQTVFVQGGYTNLTALLKRGFMALEDCKWDEAKDFFNRVLDADPECAEAYLGLVLADIKTISRKLIPHRLDSSPSGERNFRRALRFAEGELKAELEEYNSRYEELRRQQAEAKLEREERRRQEQEAEKQRQALAAEEHEKHLVEFRTQSPALRKHIAPAQYRIAAGNTHTVGLKTDGTAVMAGSTNFGDMSISDWTDLVAVAAGGGHTIGLKSNGTVVAVRPKRLPNYAQCSVDNWRDIVSIAAGHLHTVGLKANGTVVATGSKDGGKCNVSDWTDIVAVAAGESHTVGLKADGTVITTHVKGYRENDRGQCEVSGWKLFNSIDTIQQECRYRFEKEKSSLEAELPTLKGILAGKRRKQIEARLAQIEAELKKL